LQGPLTFKNAIINGDFRIAQRGTSFTIAASTHELHHRRLHHRQLHPQGGFTLALGIGANTVIFSLVYGVLLRPLPFSASEQLVSVTATRRSEGVDLPGLAQQLHSLARPVPDHEQPQVVRRLGHSRVALLQLGGGFIFETFF
jgi:hypothetical protein